MNKLQTALMNHPDYEAYALGALDLIIIDADACDFIFVATTDIDEPIALGEDDDDFDDWVDESNYNPYTGADDFECGNDDY